MSERRRLYHAPRRSAKTSENKARVRDVALRLLAERGYAATTIGAIAAGAGVGVRTVYDAFGSKRGILRGLLESFASVSTGDFDAAVDAVDADPAAQLRLTVNFVVDYFSTAQQFLDVLRVNAYAEPALAAAMRQGEALRRASQRHMVMNWAQRNVLRPNLTKAAAADILWALTSPDMYRMLVLDRRWSRQRYSSWLHRSLSELLFDVLGR